MTPFGTMSLDELVDALDAVPGDTPVRFAFGGLRPKGIASYRGFYDHLAIGFTLDGPALDTAAALRAELRRFLIGAAYEGYKGGRYTASGSTPVWVDCWGRASGTALVRVEVERGGESDVGHPYLGRVTLHTEPTE